MDILISARGLLFFTSSLLASYVMSLGCLFDCLVFVIIVIVHVIISEF